MKKIILSTIAVFWLATSAFAQQPQPQGEYHKYIVKKTDDERRKTKTKEWWGAGVIVFSRQDIPRLGTTKEVESMLSTSFSADDKFVGRVYLPKSVNQMDGAKPESIIYRIYIDKNPRPFEVEAKGETMPDGSWSSWLIDIPDNIQTAWNSLTEGKHTITIEVWSSKEVVNTTIYTDENDKAVAYSQENDNKGKFWAHGTFEVTK